MAENSSSVKLLDGAPRPDVTQAPLSRAPAAAKDGWGARLRHAAPVLIVLAALGGIGWWGHHSGWKIPSFAELFGGAESTREDWCEEHGVPESICVECNPKLFPPPKDHGFCREHGVHNCPFEHPDVAQLSATPEIEMADLERAARALALKARPENSSKCKLHDRRVQVLSDEALEKIGVDIELVTRGPIEESIAASGEIAFAPPSVAPIHTNVTGRVAQIMEAGRLGTSVKKGEVLALIEAVEVGKAKADFLQAYARTELKLKAYERLRPLAGSAVPEAQVREAETGWQEARIHLLAAEQALTNLGLPLRSADYKDLTMDEVTSRVHYLGLPHDIAKSLYGVRPAGNLVAAVAPRDGVVTSVKVVGGETVDPSKALFVIADTSRMWLLLNVRQEDAKFVKHATRSPPARRSASARTAPRRRSRASWSGRAGRSTTRRARSRSGPT
ncbi:MAG: efflux RND transporter periplasmic adaptor subunit [Gemmataceae bacterium]